MPSASSFLLTSEPTPAGIATQVRQVRPRVVHVAQHLDPAEAAALPRLVGSTRSPLPVSLAGGLRPSNVAEAIRAVRPFGVDLCSGARNEGRLDPDKLAAFMAALDDERR